MKAKQSASRCYAILPRHGIELCADDSCGPGEARRFVRLFRATWGRTPLGARRQLLDHWRVDEELGVRLDVQLLPRWKGGSKLAGVCSREGRLLRFRLPTVGEMPDDIAMILMPRAGACLAVGDGRADARAERRRDRGSLPRGHGRLGVRSAAARRLAAGPLRRTKSGITRTSTVIVAEGISPGDDQRSLHSAHGPRCPVPVRRASPLRKWREA